LTPPWIAVLATCLAMQPTNLSRQVASLDGQRDPARLGTAAVAIAGSGDTEAIHSLATYWGRASFLRRLDRAKHGQSDIDRLAHVFRVLADHPSAATEALCIGLAHDREFTSVPERLNFLLNALSAVRPMSNEGAAIFRETSHAEYLGVNGPLRAGNAHCRFVGCQAFEVMAKVALHGPTAGLELFGLAAHLNSHGDAHADHPEQCNFDPNPGGSRGGRNAMPVQSCRGWRYVES